MVHAKDLPDITGWVKERVCYVRGVGFLDGRHAVHPELGQFPVLSRPAHGVVEVPVPDEGVRAEAIAVPLMFQDLSFFGVYSKYWKEMARCSWIAVWMASMA